MKRLAAVGWVWEGVCVALLLGAWGCTIGPAGADGGTGSTTSTAPRSLGDQCQSVLTVFCQKAASCGLQVDFTECMSGNLSLCCVGSACNATSNVSESSVTACEQMIMAEDCNLVVNTMNPTACLASQ